MRKLFLLLVVVLGTWLAANTASAANELEGPYLHMDGGVAWVQNFNTSIEDLPGTLHLDPGFRLSLGAGYRLYSSSVFDSALQFETGVIRNTLSGFDSADFGPLSAGGEFWQVPFLADILYTFRPCRCVLPYVGVGGGGVYSQLEIDSLSDQPVNVSSHETDAAFQAMAGVLFRINDCNELGIGYKFLMTFPSGIDYVATHSVSLVYVFRF